MAHDGQNMTSRQTVILPDLLDVSSKALLKLQELLDIAVETLRSQVLENGRVSGKLMEENQTSAHGLAWLATYVESLRQMQKWAVSLDSDGAFGEIEKLIHQIAFGEYLWQISGGIPMSQSEILRLQDIGISDKAQKEFLSKDVKLLTQHGNTQAARIRLVELMQEKTLQSVRLSTHFEQLIAPYLPPHACHQPFQQPYYHPPHHHVYCSFLSPSHI